MAFQGLLTTSLDNEPSITGDVINQTLLRATADSVVSLGGDVKTLPLFSASVNLKVSVIGLPKINELDVLDFVDYFRTENNINFLVTEDGNFLEI